MENEVKNQEVNVDEVVVPQQVDMSKVRGGRGNPMQPPASLNIKALRRQRTPEEQQAVHERMETIRKENKEKLEEAIEGIRKGNDKVLDRLRPEILIKYHTPAAKPVEQAHMGEWFDVRAAEAYDVKAGTKGFINLGISVRVPHGYEAILAPRSSTFKKYGILQTNSIGVIDETYSGDDDIWMFPYFATRDAHIDAGDRIAQFRIQRNQGNPRLKEVRYLGKKNRGGLGSTGTK